MDMKTVSDLKTYLTDHKISPERFGRDVKISNMTIRRLLRKPGTTLIPEKYHLPFNQHTHSTFAAAANSLTALAAGLMNQRSGPEGKQDFSSLLTELERAGEGVDDMTKLESDVEAKLHDNDQIDKTLRGKIKTLVTSIRSTKLSKKEKAMAIGALLYLINPLDLIPDAIPVVGYLDDFAVISLVIGSFSALRSRNLATKAASDKAASKT